MLKSLIKPLAIASLIASSAAQALPIVEADAFTSGDNKAAYDASTGLTWMDFGVTNGKSFNQVVSELNSTYANWRLPTDAEVNTLWSRLFSENWEPFYAGYHYSSPETALVEKVTSVFGYNYGEEAPWARTDSAGFYLSDTGKVKYALISNYSYNSAAAVAKFEDYYDQEEIKSTTQGMWWSTLLVKKAQAPEPTPLLLLGLGLSLCGIRRYLR